MRVAATARVFLGCTVLLSCSQHTLDPLGYPCEADACLSGYVCHPFTHQCVVPLPVGCGRGEICPTTTQEGDSCPSVGSFLPCVDGATGCEAGCFTCREDLTWGPCIDPAVANCTPTSPSTEVCDGKDNDCDGTVDNQDAGGCTRYYRDGDSDGVGVAGDSRCLCAANAPYTASSAGDCRDDDPACGADCGTCVPRDVVVTNDGPEAACGDITVTVDLDSLPDRASQLSCEAPIFPVSFADFELDLGDWTGTSTSLKKWPGCPGGTQFLIFDTGADASVELTTPLDISGISAPELRFMAAYKNSTVAGDEIQVEACCGVGCTPAALGSVPNGAGAGTDDCTDYSFPLSGGLAGCDALWVRVGYTNGSVQAGIDHLQIGGPFDLDFPTDEGGGLYSTVASTCAQAQIEVDCTWDDGSHTPVSGTTVLDFQ